MNDLFSTINLINNNGKNMNNEEQKIPQADEPCCGGKGHKMLEKMAGDMKRLSGELMKYGETAKKKYYDMDEKKRNMLVAGLAGAIIALIAAIGIGKKMRKRGE